ncbi:MAG: hypothetical protein U0326_29905 [Polyangiales bacterium]
MGGRGRRGLRGGGDRGRDASLLELVEVREERAVDAVALLDVVFEFVVERRAKAVELTERRGAQRTGAAAIAAHRVGAVFEQLVEVLACAQKGGDPVVERHRPGEAQRAQRLRHRFEVGLALERRGGLVGVRTLELRQLGDEPRAHVEERVAELGRGHRRAQKRFDEEPDRGAVSVVLDVLRGELLGEGLRAGARARERADLRETRPQPRRVHAHRGDVCDLGEANLHEIRNAQQQIIQGEIQVLHGRHAIGARRVCSSPFIALRALGPTTRHARRCARRERDANPRARHTRPPSTTPPSPLKLPSSLVRETV